MSKASSPTRKPSRKRARTDSLAAEPADEVVDFKKMLDPQAFSTVFEKWPEKILALSALHHQLTTEPYVPSNPLLNASKQYMIHPQVNQVLDNVKSEVVVIVEDLSLLEEGDRDEIASAMTRVEKRRFEVALRQLSSASAACSGEQCSVVQDSRINAGL